MQDRLYIAATSQHVGKTTSTLGLTSIIRELGYNVGYCKPVGQEFVDLGDLRVDKDALLFARMTNFTLEPELHSPVIIGSGVTAKYLDNPADFHFRQAILNARDRLHRQHDFVVYEGTGHPGVGSVVDLSNADVARMLEAPVIMVIEGGIGSTIDKLNLNLALFREQGVEVIGVIVNKVIPQKLDKIRHYLDLKLQQMGVPLLGVLPYDRTLALPIMESISHAVRGRVVANGDRMDNRVENIASGSLLSRDEVDDLQNLLIIVSYRRLESAVHSLMEIAERRGIEGSPLAGIILNGEHDFVPEIMDNFPCQDYIEKYQVPVIATQLDTYGAALKIGQMEVKINTRTPWKVRRAVEMIRDHVDLRQVLKGQLSG